MKVNRGQKLIIGILFLYKRVASPWLRPACRFTPTCSDYARQAIEKYGVLVGSLKALRRLCACHPLHSGGFDPVN
jgi:putative membrane protein insertion efficiency factor